jgi:hypothetical protein
LARNKIGLGPLGHLAIIMMFSIFAGQDKMGADKGKDWKWAGSPILVELLWIVTCIVVER